MIYEILFSWSLNPFSEFRWDLKLASNPEWGKGEDILQVKLKGP